MVGRLGNLDKTRWAIIDLEALETLGDLRFNRPEDVFCVKRFLDPPVYVCYGLSTRPLSMKPSMARSAKRSIGLENRVKVDLIRWLNILRSPPAFSRLMTASQ